MSTADLRAQRPSPAEAQSTSKLRLALVTGEPLFREGLQAACRGARSLLLVEATTTVSDVIALATSVDMVALEATTLQRAIKMAQAVQAARGSEIAVVAVTESASTDEVKSALDAGLRGCVLKRVEVRELLDILESIGQGALIYRRSLLPDRSAEPCVCTAGPGTRADFAGSRLTRRKFWAASPVR